MHHASRSSLSLPGQLQPESVHALLRDLSDELQLVATVEALDGLWWLIEFKRSALTDYLHGAFERIESALSQSAYPARIVAIGSHAEGC